MAASGLFIAVFQCLEYICTNQQVIHILARLCPIKYLTCSRAIETTKTRHFPLGTQNLAGKIRQINLSNTVKTGVDKVWSEFNGFSTHIRTESQSHPRRGSTWLGLGRSIGVFQREKREEALPREKTSVSVPSRHICKFQMLRHHEACHACGERLKQGKWPSTDSAVMGLQTKHRNWCPTRE